MNRIFAGAVFTPLFGVPIGAPRAPLQALATGRRRVATPVARYHDTPAVKP